MTSPGKKKHRKMDVVTQNQFKTANNPAVSTNEPWLRFEKKTRVLDFQNKKTNRKCTSQLLHVDLVTPKIGTFEVAQY